MGTRTNSSNLTNRLIAIGKAVEGAQRLEDKRNYSEQMKHYTKMPDEAMSGIFEEFQRTVGDLGYKFDTEIPHQTPAEMRDYLAKMHGVLSGSRLRK